jgi:hypothetical protein
MAQSHAAQRRGWIKTEVLKGWDNWVRKQNYASDHVLTDKDAFVFYEDYLSLKREQLFSDGYLRPNPWRYVQSWLRACRNVAPN